MMGCLRPKHLAVSTKSSNFASAISRKEQNMCTCIDNIKASYSEVGRRTRRVSRRSFNRPVSHSEAPQPSIDDFLDAINVITKELHQLTQSINDLVEVVRNNFCDITTPEAEELLQLSAPINEKIRQLHRKLLRSPLYVGMETVVCLYADAMGDFEELCHDLRQFRVELEQDEEFQQTLLKLNNLLSK